METQIKLLLEKYRQQLAEIQDYYDSIEYEPAPSGEPNISVMMQDEALVEINCLEMIIEDLEALCSTS